MRRILTAVAVMTVLMATTQTEAGRRCGHRWRVLLVSLHDLLQPLQYRMLWNQWWLLLPGSSTHRVARSG